MKTSDLIKFRNSIIEQLEFYSLAAPINDICNNLQTLSNSIELDTLISADITQYIEKYQEILNHANGVFKDISGYINQLNNIIDLSGNSQINLANKEHLYNMFKFGEERDFYITTDIADAAKASINQYIDWHYPVLQFGCRYNGMHPRKTKESFSTLGGRLNDPDLFLEFEENLTGGDPFYVCDFDLKSMDNAIEKFNPIYRAKICKYQIDDSNFSSLPQEQFNFVLSWNVFNYATPDIFEEYITNIFKLLKPGGVMMFSYNNCDIPASMLMAEIGRESYMPKRHLIDMFDRLGIEILSFQDFPNEADMFPYAYVSWAEIKKPGELATVRAHSSLGKILVNIT